MTGAGVAQIIHLTLYSPELSGHNRNVWGWIQNALDGHLTDIEVSYLKKRPEYNDSVFFKIFSEERSLFRWPSLLHFAADLNLRTFTSELLRYPGMLAAACTENK